MRWMLAFSLFTFAAGCASSTPQTQSPASAPTAAGPQAAATAPAAPPADKALSTDNALSVDKAPFIDKAPFGDKVRFGDKENRTIRASAKLSEKSKAHIMAQMKAVGMVIGCTKLDKGDMSKAVSPKILPQLVEGAESGVDICQVVLGNWYEVGHQVPQSYATARDWYTKSTQKSARGYLELGRLAEQGLGQAKNLAEARRLYQLAADKDIAQAQLAIGRFHEQGLGGLSRDVGAAAAWYRKAAYQDSKASNDAWAALIRLHAGGLKDSKEQLAQDKDAWKQVVYNKLKRSIEEQRPRQNGEIALSVRSDGKAPVAVTITRKSANPEFDAALLKAVAPLPQAPLYATAETALESQFEFEWRAKNPMQVAH